MTHRVCWKVGKYCLKKGFSPRQAGRRLSNFSPRIRWIWYFSIYRMPEINGDTATRRMKAHKPDVPIALLLGDEWPPPSALEAADAVVTAERRAGKNLAPAAIKSERTFLVACVNIGCDRTGGRPRAAAAERSPCASEAERRRRHKQLPASEGRSFIMHCKEFRRRSYGRSSASTTVGMRNSSNAASMTLNAIEAGTSSQIVLRTSGAPA